MRNFDKSDYALNKFSEGIVYKFSNEIREITKEQYLRENPNETEGDFLKLKEISDEIFLDEIRYETAQGRKLVPTEDLEKLILLLQQRLLTNSTYKKKIMNRIGKNWTSCFALQSLPKNKKTAFIFIVRMAKHSEQSQLWRAFIGLRFRNV